MKTPTSTRIWFAIAGTLIFLTFSSCAALIGFISYTTSQTVSKPINQQTALTQLGNFPIYQPSTFDELTSRGTSLGASVLPGTKAIAFTTPDPAQKILTWYEQKLPNLGYEKYQDQKQFGTTQISFRKKSEILIVQVQEPTNKTTRFNLMRMNIPHQNP
jgi:hypothetical protein